MIGSHFLANPPTFGPLLMNSGPGSLRIAKNLLTGGTLTVAFSTEVRCHRSSLGKVSCKGVSPHPTLWLRYLMKCTSVLVGPDLFSSPSSHQIGPMCRNTRVQQQCGSSHSEATNVLLRVEKTRKAAYSIPRVLPRITTRR